MGKVIQIATHLSKLFLLFIMDLKRENDLDVSEIGGPVMGPSFQMIEPSISGWTTFRKCKSSVVGKYLAKI